MPVNRIPDQMKSPNKAAAEQRLGGEDSGGWLSAAAEQADRLRRQAEYIIGEYPGVCLAGATAVGVCIGWLIKRKIMS